MDVNVKGTSSSCQVFGAAMAARRPRLDRERLVRLRARCRPTQSLYDFRRQAGETFVKPVAYSVSKSALLNLTRYLATYWAKGGVRVNTLTLAGIGTSQPQRVRRGVRRAVPLGRMVEAREAVGAVVFLASDASSYVTGANLVVDGGWSAW